MTPLMYWRDNYLLQLDLDHEPRDMLQQMLETAGFMPTFRLLTTGHLPQATLADFAKGLLNSPAVDPQRISSFN